MKSDVLKKWIPCQSYCQMNGAAAALLSIRDAQVVFNGPRWCSVIAERELSFYNRNYTDRLYCSHIEQCDLLFGTGAKLTEIISEINQSGVCPSLLGVLTSCSLGLIGDDVNGIVNNMGNNYPVLALDTGGLTGLFEEGYQEAMVAILKKIKITATSELKKDCVNLLGYNRCAPNSEGDLRELKRLLHSAGFQIGVCLGQDDLTIEELREIPQAAINILLAPELGQKVAEYLEEACGQKYITLPVPYGPVQSIVWLRNIGAALGKEPQIAGLEEEIRVQEEDIGQQLALLRRKVENLYYRRAVLALPYSNMISLSQALKDSILDVERIVGHLQGNYRSDILIEPEEKADAWGDSEYQILFGTAQDRIFMGAYGHTVYLNSYKADGRIKERYKTYIGIQGWAVLLKEVFEQTLTLYLIEEERKNV